MKNASTCKEKKKETHTLLVWVTCTTEHLSSLILLTPLPFPGISHFAFFSPVLPRHQALMINSSIEI